MTRPRILTPDIYFKYFQFQDNGACCGIEKESESLEDYFFAQPYLPKSFFNLDETFLFYHPNLKGEINNLPDKIFVKFELFAIGSLGESEAFIFRPWVLNISDPILYKLFENFRLYVPGTLFYNLINRLIFLEQLNQESFSKIRILQDIPLAHFQRFGINRPAVPSELVLDNLIFSRKDYPNKDEILCFFQKNGRPVTKDLEPKYFNYRSNIWFKITSPSQDEIGYIRLYNSSSHFTGGTSIEYIIDESFRNQGIATDAAKVAVLYLRKYSYSMFVDAEVNIDNEYSLRILKKLKFEEINSNTLSSKTFILDLLNDIKTIEGSFENGTLKASIKNRYAEKYKKYI